MFLFPGGKPTKKSIGYTLGNSIVRPLKIGQFPKGKGKNRLPKPSFFRGDVRYISGGVITGYHGNLRYPPQSYPPQ